MSLHISQELNRLTGKTLVVFDIETTGLYPERGDEIVELAAEKLINSRVVSTFHALLYPTVPVPSEVVAIHGLEEQYLKNHGQPHGEVFPPFIEFIGDAVLVGHNIRYFDFPFLAAHFSRLGLPVPENELLDTLELARAVLNLPNYKLPTVAAHLGISTVGAHRAKADVAMTRQVLIELWRKIALR